MGECETLMAKLTNTAAKNKQYNELRGRLAKWLPEVEKRVGVCKMDLTPGVDPQDQFEELKVGSWFIYANKSL